MAAFCKIMLVYSLINKTISKSHGYLHVFKSMKNRLTNLGLSIVIEKLPRGEKRQQQKSEHMIRLDIKII